jgi:hypothetical protein
MKSINIEIAFYFSPLSLRQADSTLGSSFKITVLSPPMELCLDVWRLVMMGFGGTGGGGFRGGEGGRACIWFWFSSKNTFFSYMGLEFQSFLLGLVDRFCSRCLEAFVLVASNPLF